jgi:lysophospholipase L1-like esterase
MPLRKILEGGYPMTNKFFLRLKFPWLPLLLWLAGTGCVSTRANPDFSRWEKTIAVFEAGDKTNPPPKDGVLFVGASNISRWTSLAADFPGQKVFNRGFGGSFMRDVLHYADRVVLPYAPRVIVLQAGGNDLNAGRTPEEVAADFEAFAEKIRGRLPGARIIFISIPPSPQRWKQIAQVRAANQLITGYINGKPGLAFIDVSSNLVGSDGRPRLEFYEADGDHVNAKEYGVWKKLIDPQLK